MKKILLGLFTLSVLLFAACDEVFNGPVLIRVENAYDQDFNNVFVSPNTYGTVKAGEKSEYKEFETAYSYGYIQLETSGDTLIYQPIDYVGETPLKGGKYTYELDVDTSFQKPYQIILRFKKD